MAKRNKKTKYTHYLNEALDEIAAVGSLGASIGLGNVYRDFIKDTRNQYITNITKATRKKPPIYRGPDYSPNQIRFQFMNQMDKKIKLDPLLTPHEAKKAKALIYTRFKRDTRGRKFRTYADLKTDFTAIKKSF